MMLLRHDRRTELDKQQTSKPVMVGVVSSIPTGGNFIFLAETLLQKCQNYQISSLTEGLWILIHF